MCVDGPGNYDEGLSITDNATRPITDNTTHPITNNTTSPIIDNTTCPFKAILTTRIQTRLLIKGHRVLRGSLIQKFLLPTISSILEIYVDNEK